MSISANIADRQFTSIKESTAVAGQAAQVVVNPDGTSIGNVAGIAGSSVGATAAVAPVNATEIGGVFNTTPPTYTNGQLGQFQINNRGGMLSIIADPITPANQATVAAFHNQDNTSTGSGFGILTGGSAQFINVAGNLDRQRETGVDNIAALGISTGSAQFAMAFKTTDSTDNFAAGTRTFTPVLMSGTLNGASWKIQVGSVLILDTGASAENVVVTATTATTFTCVTANAHNGTVTAFPITGFTYNQERDAAGELDGAFGTGTAVAAAYEYNSGGPGTSTNNYDRARNLQGKGRTASTLNSAAMAATTGVTSIVFTAATNLNPGQPVYFEGLGAANFEVMYTALNYTAGSTTVLLQSGNANTHANGVSVAWDTYVSGGPGVIGFLPTGVGIEEEALWDPVNNLFYLERSATQDTAVGQNVVMENAALFSGTTNFERSRSITALSQSTLNGTLNSFTNSGTGIPIELMLGWDSTGAAQAYRAIAVDATGAIVTSATTPSTVKGTLTNNNAAPAANNIGALPALANAAAPTWTEGNQTLVSLNLKGEMRTLLSQAGNPAVITNATPSGAATYGLTVRPYASSDGTNTTPTMDAAVRRGFQQLTDGTTNVSVIVATSALKTDLSSVAGTATSVNNGAVDAGTVRVTLANNSTGIVSLTTGAATIGALTANQSVNVNQIAGSATSTAAAGVQKVGVVGNANGAFDAATNAAPPANIVYQGVLSANALPTAVTVTNTVAPMADKFGRQTVLLNSVRDLTAWQATTITASVAETTIVTAGAAGIFNDLVKLIATNSSATALTLTIRDATGAGTPWKVAIAANGGAVMDFNTPLPQGTAANNWTATSDTSVTSIQIMAQFVKNK